jgi:regulatory protein YycI of two-component signal transduction system YycFG
MKYLLTIIIILLLLLAGLFFVYIILDNWANNMILETLQANGNRQIGEEFINHSEIKS